MKEHALARRHTDEVSICAEAPACIQPWLSKSEALRRRRAPIRFKRWHHLRLVTIALVLEGEFDADDRAAFAIACVLDLTTEFFGPTGHVRKRNGS